MVVAMAHNEGKLAWEGLGRVVMAGPYATVRDTSLEFRLNRHQHQIFTKCALALMRAWAADVEIPADRLPGFLVAPDNEPPLLAHLVGPAGYGKSRVIEALLAFARVWERPGSVVVTAFTGSAAMNAGGINIHALFGWTPASMPTVPTPTARRRLGQVKLLIVDEISAAGQSLIGRVSQCLKVHQGCRTRVMGGVACLLIGDWLQMPPTCGSTLFSVPCPGDRNFPDCLAGWEVWDAINYVGAGDGGSGGCEKWLGNGAILGGTR
jgi:hypothetical protein